jgi:uncharacterized protein (TIGR02145 family)
MKALINSLKRTHWFKVSVAVLTCLLFLVFPSCQKDELNQDTIPEMSPSVSSQKGKPTITVGKIKDVDGNWYKTVKIGEQWWMAENLKTTKYRNRDLIGTTDPATLDIGGESTPKYQWAYDGIESNVSTFGRLYTFYAVTDSRNLCPTGWHVPTDAEWKILEMFIGMTQTQTDETGSRGTTEGDKLKEIGTAHWDKPNAGSTDEFGLTALPGGYRIDNKTFASIGSYSIWWSSTESSPANAWFRGLSSYDSDVDRYDSWEMNGFSVRCIKN